MLKLIMLLFVISITGVNAFVLGRDLDVNQKTGYDMALVKLQQKEDEQKIFVNQFSPKLRNKVEHYAKQIKNVCSIDRQSKSTADFVLEYSLTNIEKNKELAYRIFYYSIRYNLNYSIIESKPTYLKFKVVGEPYNINGFEQHVRGVK